MTTMMMMMMIMMIGRKRSSISRTTSSSFSFLVIYWFLMLLSCNIIIKNNTIYNTDNMMFAMAINDYGDDYDDDDNEDDNDNDDHHIMTKEEIGSRDRFWKHHLEKEELLYDGVNYYHQIKNCISFYDDGYNDNDNEDDDDPLYFNEKERAELLQLMTHSSTTTTVVGNTDDAIITDRSNNSKIGRIVYDQYRHNIPILVVIKNAISPIEVKSIQKLASCLKIQLPHLYESRAMYKEFNKDYDDNNDGGNCPTHIAPLIGLFLPGVSTGMDITLQKAFNQAEWNVLVKRDEVNTFIPRFNKMYPPNQVGIRASEHLSYKDFPSGLGVHTDGGGTIYTMNYAFSSPADYKGGEFYIIAKHPMNTDNDDIVSVIKPNKYDCMIFLGGKYYHGVQKMFDRDDGKDNKREMFSTELWAYPDTPFGSNLWSNFPENMEEYVENCNEEYGVDNECLTKFELKTPFHDSLDDLACKYDENEDENGNCSSDDNDEDNHDEKDDDGEKDDEKDDEANTTDIIDITADRFYEDDNERPNRIQPTKLVTYTKISFDDVNGNKILLDDYYKSIEDEYDFLIPLKKLDVGEMVPIIWREDYTPIDGNKGESFVIGFPPELHEEFTDYVKNSGMMKLAHSILYKEKSFDKDEQRIYTLDDGEKWTAMIQGTWSNTDMVWLDPGDESCYESLLGVLRRGGFDKVLDSIGKTFDLNGLMLQGIGAIFLSQNENGDDNANDNMYYDLDGSRGSFYKIIIPVHIPAGDIAKFMLSDYKDYDKNGPGTIKLDPNYNIGIVLGGESSHGTGECNYRSNEDFRLSFAVYVADISDANIDLITTTSLWPTTSGWDNTLHWFEAQKNRIWTKNGTNSLLHDKGRLTMNIQDYDVKACSTMKEDLCMTDLQGMRSQCPKTCELYFEDDVYYAKYFPNRK